MLKWGELDELERQLKAAVLALQKRKIFDITLVEAIDYAELWSEPFENLLPFAPSSANLDSLLTRSPLLVCAIASEIGFRFEGVGTVFWAKFGDALGLPITTAQRQKVGDTFQMLASRYNLARPSESAFSTHFSIISWPIANALLPLDLVGPVTRLIARAPVVAMPAPGRSTNFASLRAWASAAEGARLADWLRLEEPSARVLTAVLTENRGAALSLTSYTRLRDAIAAEPEAFFAARSALLRLRLAKSPAFAEQSLGRLSIMRDPSGVRMFVSWPALPAALFEDARGRARSAGWRPQLWGAGSLLHPDTALSAGPFAIGLQETPASDSAAYADAAAIYGEGSEVAAALAARSVDWAENLLFDANDDRTQAEQRFDIVTGTSGHVWIAAKSDVASLGALRKLGSSCGYAFFEANLANDGDRTLLTQRGLFSAHGRSEIIRHPIDAIGAPQGVVRPNRPFVLENEGLRSESECLPQTLTAGARFTAVSGQSGGASLRCEPAPPADDGVVHLILFERDSAFEALIERRLQLRIESRLPLKDVPISSELEIDGVLIARGSDHLSSLPVTVPTNSPLFAPLYDDAVRTRLLEKSRGMLHLAIGRSSTVRVLLQRTAASVEWMDCIPHLVGSNLEATLVGANARTPHHFAATHSIEAPERGAAAFGLQLSDGRMADPIRLFASNTFDLGDLTANFGDTVGSRRMFDHGRGVGEMARSRIAWARALCVSLATIGARTRIVRQFEEPLVLNLCGNTWHQAEMVSKADPSDPHDTLWTVAIERGLVYVPEDATLDDAEVFAAAFKKHARMLDPLWPQAGTSPADGAMDDALNIAFSEATATLHKAGELLSVDDDFDFGSPAEDWNEAAAEALHRIRFPSLVRLIAPSEGGRELSLRSYTDLTIPEMAEDLSAWTRNWALPRGRLTPEAAASVLQLWLSPAACNGLDAAVRILAADPFVARATRYASLRLRSSIAKECG